MMPEKSMPASFAIMASLASTKWRWRESAASGGIAAMANEKKPKNSDLRALMARRLKAAREAYEPNASALARALDLDPRVLHKYEKGTTFPDEMFLVRFSEVTGCPLDFIFRGKITQDMPAILAARIGVIDPGLVLGEPSAEKTAAAGHGFGTKMTAS